METKNRKRTTQGSHAEDRTLPWWVRPIVLFHVFAITVWSLPPPAPGFATGSIVPSVNTPLRASSHAMIAPPSPSETNVGCTCAEGAVQTGEPSVPHSALPALLIR